MESGMAAVMATRFGMLFAHLHDGLAERRGVAAGLQLGQVVHVLDRVVLGGPVAPTLLRQHVHDDGAFEL